MAMRAAASRRWRLRHLIFMADALGGFTRRGAA